MGIDGISGGLYGYSTAKTYPGCLAGTDVVAQPWDVAWVTHEDGGGDLLLSSSRNRDRCAGQALVCVASTTVRVIHDLATLRVPNEDEERIRALCVEGVDLACDSGDTLDDRVGVADAAA